MGRKASARKHEPVDALVYIWSRVSFTSPHLLEHFSNCVMQHGDYFETLLPHAGDRPVWADEEGTALPWRRLDIWADEIRGWLAWKASRQA